MKLKGERERLEKHNVFKTFIDILSWSKPVLYDTSFIRKKNGTLCMSLSLCFRILQTVRLINAPSFYHSFYLFLILFTFQRGLMNRKPGGLCCDTKETGIKREKRRKGKMNKIWHKNVTRDRVTKQLTGCCLTKNYWEFYFFNHVRKEYGLLNKLISSGPGITWNLKKNNLNLEIV